MSAVHADRAIHGLHLCLPAPPSTAEQLFLIPDPGALKCIDLSNWRFLNKDPLVLIAPPLVLHFEPKR